MAAKRPWWHEIVAGLSTEPIAPRPSDRPVAPATRVGPLAEPQYGDEPAVRSPRARSTGGFICRKVAVWDPGSPAMEWVRRVTHDGRAIAIRREQDARAGRGAHVLGITPLPVRASGPRVGVTIGPLVVERRPAAREPVPCTRSARSRRRSDRSPSPPPSSPSRKRVPSRLPQHLWGRGNPPHRSGPLGPSRRRAAPPARRERAAFALTAILPWASAGFILGDSEAMITNRPADETISRLIRALSTYGASSVDAAQSTLGRLMSWVVVHHPEARVVEGSHVSDFLAQDRPSAATLASLAWLRDHCGLAIPARGPACRPYKGRPPAATHTKESLSLDAVVGLEFLATHHPSALVRGQAGGWSLLVRLALRVEQAQSCVLNAVVRHEFQGKLFTFVVGAVRRDKNPNPAQRRPRPVWGVIDGLDSPDCLYRALQEMLSGVESSRFLIRDTDRRASPARLTTNKRAHALARAPPRSPLICRQRTRRGSHASRTEHCRSPGSTVSPR